MIPVPENYKSDYNDQVAQPTTPPTQEQKQPTTPPTQEHEQPHIDITPYFAQVGAIMNQVNDQGKALLAQLNASFINELNSMQSQIEDAFKRMLGGVDPATEQALARIKGTVETQRQNLMNEMNRRGLLQSGIWLEMENRLNQNQLSEEQALLLNRVKALQDQYLAQLWNFAKARLNYMSEYNKNAMNQWNTYAQGIQNQLKNSMDAATKVYQQQQQNYRTGIEQQGANYRAGIEQQGANYRAEIEQQGANYRAELPYQYPTANAMLPYELGPTPYQQEQLKIDRRNANTNAARVNAPDTPTQTQIANYYIASAINKMNEFSTLQEKNDWLYAHKAEIIANAGPSAYQYLLEQLYPSYR
ncbi:hypothetical protein BR63_05610 [Thermanaerosceptrum fracticalcis]|uniref:Uncharacterized protein n=1 Tax=Thermanaerosceptrum fracticalcis TaxID=1712410 RepID=A0A7G6E181_THEFR|nr:hypothetical protein [Thermanaerosceptrum fracticalcis]QNB45835.1 hypothetical protein BR63_05610 [Thermanaerosceptrum fracticalcis]